MGVPSHVRTCVDEPVTNGQTSKRLGVPLRGCPSADESMAEVPSRACVDELMTGDRATEPPALPDEHTSTGPATNDPSAPSATKRAREMLAPPFDLRMVAPTFGFGSDINLPVWSLPITKRSFMLRFSVLSQIDGLLYKCQGRGARIERDVLAVYKSSAVCEVYGCAKWQSTASFCGLYMCDFKELPTVVAVVASHRVYGVFIVPAATHR